MTMGAGVPGLPQSARRSSTLPDIPPFSSVRDRACLRKRGRDAVAARSLGAIDIGR